MGKLTRFKWIGAFLGATVITLLFREFAFTSCLIPSNGMENTLYEGERIIVNKWSYGLRVPLMHVFNYHRWGERALEKKDIVVFNNPAAIQERDIEQREVYISRCIGTPGDTLLVDSLFSRVASSTTPANPDQKTLYAYPAHKEREVISLMNTLSIQDNKLMGKNDSTHVRSFSHYEYYLLEQAIQSPTSWLQPLNQGIEHPLKPIIVPGKNRVLKVHPWNITLLCNTLVLHEHRKATIQNDTLYVDGKPTQHCRFTQDYYWMESNNSINLTDSRLFGFVPKNHVIGKATLIWFSKEKESGLLEGYRWNRFFKRIN